MSKEFFLTKWIRGWRLDKFFDNLFQHSPNGEITVQEAAAKVVVVIDQSLALWAQYEPLFDSIVSDDAQDSADDVKAELASIKQVLLTVQTLPDIADALKDYRFAEDDERNDFYHSLVSTAALSFSDGEISVFEALAFVAQVAVWVKEN